MADIQVLIKIQAEVPEAVPLAQDVGSVLRTELARNGHQVQVKVLFYCERCGGPMTVRGKTLICDSCLCDEATEAELDRRMGPPSRPVPIHVDSPLEAAVF